MKLNRFAIPLACILAAARNRPRNAASAVCVGLMLTIGACSTPQVTATCQEAAMVAQAASPYLIAASPEVKTAVALVGAGAVACGSPEYAAARNVVLAFLASRGVRLP